MPSIYYNKNKSIERLSYKTDLYDCLFDRFRQELHFIRLRSIISAASTQFIYSCQPIAVAISLVTLLATGTELTFYNTFVALSLINSVRLTLSFELSMATTRLADFITALHRIQAFLELEECELLLDENEASSLNNANREDRKNLLDAQPEEVIKETFKEANQIPATRIKIVQVDFKHVTCYWNDDSTSTPALRDVSLTVSTSELVLVTGAIGSGKSSLLLAVLNELLVSQGKVFCSGQIAYTSQQPWIFSGTVRENILFGQKMDRDRYNMAIHACELEADLAKFTDGDLTVIGERGVLLSGGQRSRVGLARAVYMNADVYLLDDPLSAVDAKVGRQIFEKCICGVLSQKTRILATHQLQLLKHADQVIVMKEGSIVQEGSYHELLEAGLDLDIAKGSIKDGLSGVEITRRDHGEGLLKEEAVGLEIKSDDRMTGSVSSGLYWEQFRAALNSPSIVMLIVFFCFVQGIVTF